MRQFHDKKEIVKRKKIIRNVIGFGIFLILCAVGLLTYSGKLFNSIGRPIWKTQKVITDDIGALGYMVRTKSSIYKENENLIQENENLKVSMVDYQILKNENDQLKELLGRLPANPPFILANILAKPNRSVYDSIIIDVGSDNGLVIGNRVYADAKVPIGEISKIYSNTSLVTLYSNPGQTTDGIIEGPNATVGLVGRGGGNFEMTIPLDLLSEKGVMVTLPGSSSEVVAIIDGVVSSLNEPVKKVILHSPVNVQNLKWVEVKKY
jgi:rod shape-determining protein MreC